MLADCLLCTNGARRELELRATAIRSEVGLRRRALNLAAADLLSESDNTTEGLAGAGGDGSKEATDE